jgi:hypothetical protein
MTHPRQTSHSILLSVPIFFFFVAAFTMLGNDGVFAAAEE